MNKHPKNKDVHASSSIKNDTNQAEAVNKMTEDPEIPATFSKQENSTSLYQDVERKKKEMNNSTIGGF